MKDNSKTILTRLDTIGGFLSYVVLGSDPAICMANVLKEEKFTSVISVLMRRIGLGLLAGSYRNIWGIGLEVYII